MAGRGSSYTTSYMHFQQIAETLNYFAVGRWCPIGGTLLSFMRYGASQGFYVNPQRVDIADIDFDVMVLLETYEQWYSLVSEITSTLVMAYQWYGCALSGGGHLLECYSSEGREGADSQLDVYFYRVIKGSGESMEKGRRIPFVGKEGADEEAARKKTKEEKTMKSESKEAQVVEKPTTIGNGSLLNQLLRSEDKTATALEEAFDKEDGRESSDTSSNTSTAKSLNSSSLFLKEYGSDSDPATTMADELFAINYPVVKTSWKGLTVGEGMAGDSQVTRTPFQFDPEAISLPPMYKAGAGAESQAEKGEAAESRAENASSEPNTANPNSEITETGTTSTVTQETDAAVASNAAGKANAASGSENLPPNALLASLLPPKKLEEQHPWETMPQPLMNHRNFLRMDQLRPWRKCLAYGMAINCPRRSHEVLKLLNNREYLPGNISNVDRANMIEKGTLYVTEENYEGTVRILSESILEFRRQELAKIRRARGKGDIVKVPEEVLNFTVENSDLGPAKNYDSSEENTTNSGAGTTNSAAENDSPKTSMQDITKISAEHNSLNSLNSMNSNSRRLPPAILEVPLGSSPLLIFARITEFAVLVLASQIASIIPSAAI